MTKWLQTVILGKWYKNVYKFYVWTFEIKAMKIPECCVHKTEAINFLFSIMSMNFLSLILSKIRNKTKTPQFWAFLSMTREALDTSPRTEVPGSHHYCLKSWLLCKCGPPVLSSLWLLKLVAQKVSCSFFYCPFWKRPKILWWHRCFGHFLQRSHREHGDCHYHSSIPPLMLTPSFIWKADTSPWGYQVISLIRLTHLGSFESHVGQACIAFQTYS